MLKESEFLLEENEYFMKFLVLSYFNRKFGIPRIFLHVPEPIRRSVLDKRYVFDFKATLISQYVPLLMNSMTRFVPREKVFFINEFGEIKSERVKILTNLTLNSVIKSDNLIFTNPRLHKFSEMKSANLIFIVPNPVAKYKKQLLMISIVIRNEENVDLNVFHGLLEQIVNKLKEIKDLYKGFYYYYKKEEKFEDTHQIYTEIKDLLNSVYQSFLKDYYIGDGKNSLPFPYIFKPPSPPGDLGLSGQAQLKSIPKEEDIWDKPYCKNCGSIISEGQSICHVCGKKVI